MSSWSPDMKTSWPTLAALVLPLCLIGCNVPNVQPSASRSPNGPINSGSYVEAQHGVVVSISSPASAAGVSILQQGGNAVDAAVATAFALAVTYPPAGNIGGGGFMLVHPAPGKGAPVAIDYRETAPAAAYPAMFSRQESQFTHRAVAVPGTVRGLALAHRRYGRLPWVQLLQPAIRLARNGFILDAHLANFINEIRAATPGFAELQRVFSPPGSGLWKPGDQLRQPDLARTLQTLADQGPDAFYSGPIAAGILAEMGRGRGLITSADLDRYQAIERRPLTIRYRDTYDIYVPPPPSSGGICLLEELLTLQNIDLKSLGRWSPTTLHVMAEAMRRANLDRARYLGDPAFINIPTELVTRDYGRKLAGTIDLHRATPSKDLSAGIPLTPESENTTHFSVIDESGMAVANTYTLERLWGSRIVVKDMGFLLNNDMRAFNLFPGMTDTKGMIGTEPNVIAPGKRPISSMSPTIVAQHGRVKLVTGSPGSQSIPHTILCLIVNTLDFGMPVQTAVEAPRLSHAWFPDEISFESPENFPAMVESLSAMGHKVVKPGPLPQGDAQTIWVVKPNRYVGVADHRRNDKAAAAGF